MTYVEVRPPAYHRDFRQQDDFLPLKWNPKEQEVIVIGDSSSPERIVHHEPPSNNTRNAASRRRRQPEQAHFGQDLQHFHSLGDYGHVPHLQPTNEPQSFDPYSSRIAAYHPGLAYAASPSYNQTSSSTIDTNRYALDYNTFRGSYTSPYHNQQHARAVVGNGKRKRDDMLENYTDYAGQLAYSRNETYTTQSSVSSRHSRIQMKNLEVILRKEPETAPNYSGKTFDDSEGHYVIEPQSELTYRYRIEKLLGQGTFGKVVRAYDRRHRVWVAIKIIRAVQKYRDASMIELRVLRTLKENDPHNVNKCIHLQDCFDYRNHVCIVTELLNVSIFDFLKSNSFASFPLHHIIDFAAQLFKSVAFLHKLDLIHTDLKPENILLVDNASDLEVYNGRKGLHGSRRVLRTSDIRLIDFGSATFEDEYHSNVVSTRHYRAPEIILGMGWSFPCDIWSVGCILIEFYTGDALFQTHDNLEHLAMMEVVCGRIDGRIIRSCSKIAQKMFRPSGRLDYPNRETSKDSKKFVKQMKSLAEMFPPSSMFNYEFRDLLSRIFAYDPKDRITAEQALKHSFFDPHLRQRVAQE